MTACNSCPPSASTRSAMSSVCSICLDNLSQRSVLYPCCHEFDFACIREWCKGSIKCPVCRMEGKEIMHDIKSLDEYRIWKLDGADDDDDGGDASDDEEDEEEDGGDVFQLLMRQQDAPGDDSIAAGVRSALVAVASETEDFEELILLIHAIAALRPDD